jgi:hypothetical protein
LTGAGGQRNCHHPSTRTAWKPRARSQNRCRDGADKPAHEAAGIPDDLRRRVPERRSLRRRGRGPQRREGGTKRIPIARAGAISLARAGTRCQRLAAARNVATIRWRAGRARLASDHGAWWSGVGVAGASCTLAIDDPTGDIAPLAVATGPSPAEHEGFAGPLVWVGRSDQRHVAGLSIGRVGADRARGR